MTTSAASDTNEIHPTAVLEGDITLGRGNRIGPYSVLTGPLVLGDDNWIGPHVVLGSPGQDTRNPRYDCSQKQIRIGSRNIIREFTAVQKPAYQDLTAIGDDVYLMQSVHIPHDAILEDKVVVTPMVALAGITRILEGANLGMGATINQYCVVGQYSIIATGAPVMKNVRPFSRYIPGKPASVNAYAVKKFGLEEFTDEINRYVLEGIAPKTERVGAIVAHFIDLAAISQRETY